MLKIRNMGDCLVGAICAPQGCDTVPDAVHPDDVSFLHFYVGPETENPRSTFSGSPWHPGVQLRQCHGKGLVWDLEIVIKGKAVVSPPAVAERAGLKQAGLWQLPSLLKESPILFLSTPEVISAVLSDPCIFCFPDVSNIAKVGKHSFPCIKSLPARNIYNDFHFPG